MPREEFISLCEVYETVDKYRRLVRKLRRHFDVDLSNNQLVPCRRNAFDQYGQNTINLDTPQLYDERFRIGSWGLWKWWRGGKGDRAEPYTDLSPIQVIKQPLSLKVIIEQLKSGIQDFRIKGNIQTLFVNNRGDSGILCDWSNFEGYEGVFRLRKDVYSLLRINFSPDSILTIHSDNQDPIYFLVQDNFI